MLQSIWTQSQWKFTIQGFIGSVQAIVNNELVALRTGIPGSSDPFQLSLNLLLK